MSSVVDKKLSDRTAACKRRPTYRTNYALRSHSNETKLQHSDENSDEQIESEAEEFTQKYPKVVQEQNRKQRLQNTSKVNEKLEEEKWPFNPLVLLGIPVLILAIFFAVLINGNPAAVSIKCNTTKEIQRLHPEVSSEVFAALEVALQEIKRSKKPSVLIYLYRDRTEEEIQRLVQHLAELAMCQLGSPNKTVLELPKEEYSSAEARKDYGILLNNYKEKLLMHRVLVVRHLDQVPGEVAPVFHPLCDDSQPFAESTLYVFLIRVKNYEPSDFKLVENILKIKWDNLDTDTFAPLIARITGSIVRI